MFKHYIRGYQPKVPNYALDSPNFLSLECFVSLECPPISKFSEDADAGVHHREMTEEPERGAPFF